MGIITISRTMGSLGSQIGKQVSKELGMKCIGKEIISKIMKEYGFAKYNDIYNEIPSFWDRYDEMRVQTFDFVSKTIEAIGHHDNIVIVGRGGYEIFEDFADVLNVRTDAPLDIRIKRKMKEHNMDEMEARKVIIHHDRVRKAYLESELQHRYNDTQSFDLVLNTGCVLPDMATKVIVDAFKNLMLYGKNKNSKYLNQMQIDPVLEEVVQKYISEI